MLKYVSCLKVPSINLREHRPWTMDPCRLIYISFICSSSLITLTPILSTTHTEKLWHSYFFLKAQKEPFKLYPDYIFLMVPRLGSNATPHQTPHSGWCKSSSGPFVLEKFTPKVYVKLSLCMLFNVGVSLINDSIHLATSFTPSKQIRVYHPLVS
jgi:hypothetical protein